MNSGKTGLGTSFANLGKPVKTTPTPDAPTEQPPTSPAPKAKAAAKPVGGRKITVRDLSDEDLRRLSEFRHTHKLTIQALAIEGLSLSLRARGLKPLSGADADAIDALLANLAR